MNGALVAFQAAGVNIAGCATQPLTAGVATCTTGVLGAGTLSIAAIYQGNAATLASTSTALLQVVNKADQTIAFDALANKQDTDPPFSITATVSSGLPVAFTSLTALVCTVSGSTVTILLGGTCTIAANQSGNANYNAAPQVTQSFAISSSGPALALVSVVSRKVHGGAGTFEIAINPVTAISGLIDVESRAIGAGHTIVFRFNNPITLSGVATAVDAGSVAIGTAMPAISGNDVVVTLTGIPDVRRVRVSLTNVNGVGVNVSASVGFLSGDVTNSRNVNISDINGVKLRSGQVTSTANMRYDLNASGTINISDINSVKLRSGNAL